jgi:hypothetical protein
VGAQPAAGRGPRGAVPPGGPGSSRPARREAPNSGAGTRNPSGVSDDAAVALAHHQVGEPGRAAVRRAVGVAHSSVLARQVLSRVAALLRSPDRDCGLGDARRARPASYSADHLALPLCITARGVHVSEDPTPFNGSRGIDGRDRLRTELIVGRVVSPDSLSTGVWDRPTAGSMTGTGSTGGRPGSTRLAARTCPGHRSRRGRSLGRLDGFGG